MADQLPTSDQSKVAGTIQAGSINTNDEKRDKHLRAKDFFDVATYPTITFESTEIADVDTAAVARMVAGLGRDFSRPEVMASFRSTPRIAADQMVDLVVEALRSSAPTDPPQRGSR